MILRTVLQQTKLKYCFSRWPVRSYHPTSVSIAKSTLTVSFESLLSILKGFKNAIFRRPSELNVTFRRSFKVSAKCYGLSSVAANFVSFPVAGMVVFVIGRYLSKYYLGHVVRASSNVSKWLSQKLGFEIPYYQMCFVVFFIVFLTGLYYVYVRNMEPAPFTGRQRFMARSYSDNTEFYLTLCQHKENFLPQSSPYVQKVENIFRKIVQNNPELESLLNEKFKVSVIDSVMINAITSGDDLLIFKGMIDLCSTDDQVAYLISHELANHVLKHPAEMASYIHLMNLTHAGGCFILSFLVPGAQLCGYLTFAYTGYIILLYFFKRSALLKRFQKECDEVAINLVKRSQFDFTQSVTFCQKMHLIFEVESYLKPQTKSDMEENGKYGFNIFPRNRDYLKRHPNIRVRAEILRELLSDTLGEDCKLPEFDPKGFVTEEARKLEQLLNLKVKAGEEFLAILNTEHLA